MEMNVKTFAQTIMRLINKMMIICVLADLLVIATTATDQVEVAIPCVKFDCSSRNVRVIFQDVALSSGDGTQKVYSRSRASFITLVWAGATAHELDAADFQQCGRLAAAQDFGAFAFTEGCTGYELARPLCKCGDGEMVIYVREDFSESSGSLVLLQDGVTAHSVPVNLLGQNYSLEMLAPRPVPLVDIDCPGYLCAINLKRPVNDISEVAAVWGNMLSSFHYILPDVLTEKGAALVPSQTFDFNSRRTASSCGMPALRSYRMQKAQTKYFLEECGQTIYANQESSFFLYSHRGFGSVYFPSGDSSVTCNVTVVCPNNTVGIVWDTVDFVGDSACGGYSLQLRTYQKPPVDLCKNINKTTGLTSDSAKLISPPPREAAGYMATLTLSGSSSSSRKVRGFLLCFFNSVISRHGAFESNSIPIRDL